MRALLSLFWFEVDGDDEETRKFSSAVEEEDDGVGVLLLSGLVGVVEDVEEVEADALASSAAPELLHGDVSTARSLPVCSRWVSEKERGTEERREWRREGGREWGSRVRARRPRVPLMERKGGAGALAGGGELCLPLPAFGVVLP